MTTTVAALSKEIRRLETANRDRGEGSHAFSCGCSALDTCLPDGGYRPGSVIEWLSSTGGGEADYLALLAAREAVSGGKFWVVVDRQQRFYPPAAAALGLPLDRLIVVRPMNQADEWWSIDHALRSPAIGAVVARLDQLSELQARRFQLAAEEGGSLGLWVRPPQARRIPSWAEIQWWLEPPGVSVPVTVASRCSSSSNSKRSFRMTALRMRGGKSGQSWTLAIDLHHGRLSMEPHHAIPSHLSLASELAMPTVSRHHSRRAQKPAIRAASA